MIKKINKNELRLRKHLRVRKKIAGTNERPRLNVFRSYIYTGRVKELADGAREAGLKF